MRNGLREGVDIIRTIEWFGYGHSAYQEILISKKLSNIIIENEWKGVSLKPIDIT
jgi:hypothetical protein